MEFVLLLSTVLLHQSVGLQDIQAENALNNDPVVPSLLARDTRSLLSAADKAGSNVQEAEGKSIDTRGSKGSTTVKKWTLYDRDGNAFEENIKDLCISSHQYLRKQHLKSFKVKYLKRLENDAQRWAQYLVDSNTFVHDDGVYRDFGENIYKLDVNYDYVPNPVNALECWYTESWQPNIPYAPPSNYNYKFNPSSKSEIKMSGVGHFTQLIWDKSVKIGCGAATKKYKKGKVMYTKTIIVARYLVPGNQIKEFPKHVFPLRNGEKTLKGLTLAKLFPGKRDCVDSGSPELCSRWKRFGFCDKMFAQRDCGCTCSNP